jgi:competence protein ComFA
VIGLYSTSTKYKEGDIIVLTTHQLYRYEKYFDLLIIDEVDAFPFKDNIVLNKFFFNAIKGNFIMMSATLDKDNISMNGLTNYDFYRLSKRYHNHPLIVPKVIISPLFKKWILIYHMLRFSKENKPLLVFLPTINECEELYFFIKVFVKNGNYVHSKKKDRDQIVSSFKHGKYKYLLTTSILERGITIKDLQVIIFSSDHSIFTSDTLIQISGRVGRKIDSWDGEVIYISKRMTVAMKESIEKIKKDNHENCL